MTPALQEQSNRIFHEMMSHPALFTHPHPMNVVIIGDEDSRILQEVIKHEYLANITFINKTNTVNNPKIHFHSGDLTDWIKKAAPHSIDIIVHAGDPSADILKHFYNLLTQDGILIQQSHSPFEMNAIISLADQLRTAGFKDQQMLNFPQPGFATGWRSIIMATRQSNFKRIREQAIFAKTFKTYYYNLDTHKASLVLPEFMRAEWVI